MRMLITVLLAVFLFGCTNANSAEFDFAMSLLNKLPANESCIFSPLSISLALSLVHSGTKGAARREIEQVLLNGTVNEEFSQHFSDLIRSIRNSSKVELELANRVYVRKGYSLLDSYLSSVKNNYNASSITLDFNDKVESAEAVNSFVNETTHGKITEIVTPEMFTDALRMILVNAVYMKGEWADKFESYKIETKKFYVNETSEKEVEYLLHNYVYRDYYENDQYQLLSLKYKDQRYRFNVFLPKNKFELEKLQTDVTGTEIEDILGELLYNQFVHIELPKFKLESKLKLIDTLMAMGIKKMFDGGEDLSGFSEDDQLAVSDVIHKATIEVSEGGTVAAAVTAVLELEGSSGGNWNPPQPTNFYADHPFMFCITFDNHPVSEEGTIASAVTEVEMLSGSAGGRWYRPVPIHFYADHPFMFCITFDNHPVFIGTYY